MQGKVAEVNLYDGHYSDHLKEAQSKVRIFTYGKDGKTCHYFCYAICKIAILKTLWTPSRRQER